MIRYNDLVFTEKSDRHACMPEFLHSYASRVHTYRSFVIANASFSRRDSLHHFPKFPFLQPQVQVSICDHFVFGGFGFGIGVRGPPPGGGFGRGVRGRGMGIVWFVLWEVE